MASAKKMQIEDDVDDLDGYWYSNDSKDARLTHFRRAGAVQRALYLHIKACHTE
jgi:hypothetical protein